MGRFSRFAAILLLVAIADTRPALLRYDEYLADPSLITPVSGKSHLIAFLDVPKAGSLNTRTLLKSRCRDPGKEPMPPYVPLMMAQSCAAAANGSTVPSPSLNGMKAKINADEYVISGHHATMVMLKNAVATSAASMIPVLLDRVLFFTFVREPIARAVSEWGELAIGRDNWGSFPGLSKDELNLMKTAEGMALFLLHPACPAHNRHTWTLATSEHVVRIAKATYNNATAEERARRYKFSPHCFACLYSWYYDDNELFAERLNDDDELLAHAKHTLERDMFFVGITESTGEFWDDFDRVMGHQYIFSLPPLTTSQASAAATQHRNRLSDQGYDALMKNKTLLSEVKRRNRLDLQLYDFAKELVERRRLYILSHKQPG